MRSATQPPARGVTALFILAVFLASRVVASGAGVEEGAGRDSGDGVRALKLDELHAIDGVIGSARVIGFAEFSHLQPECLAFRNQLFQYLVQEHGVTAIAAETSFLHALAVDDYVLGKGESRPTDEVVHAVFTWSPHAVAENRQLIEWMRVYNAQADAGRKLRFHGIDFAGFRPGEDPYGHARELVDFALSYLAALDPAAARDFSKHLTRGLAEFKPSTYPSLAVSDRRHTSEALAGLAALFDRNHTAWVRKTSALQFDRARQAIEVARAHERDFVADPAEREAGSAREQAMAQTVAWALEQEGSGGRLFLFASFNHLSRGANPRYRDGQLGTRLGRMLGNEYVPIGSYWRVSEVFANGASNAQRADAPPDANAVADPVLRSIAAGLAGPYALLARAETGFDAIVFIQPRAAPYGY